jgi:uncharacterized membrane protein YdjX (TVP38/TMEM64 family)
MQSRRDLYVRIIWVVIVLAIPVVPFLFWGGAVEAHVEQLLHHALPPLLAAALAAALLATDIFVPIPSSIVSTLAASACGFWLGLAASWIGMTVGSLIGFLLARLLGRRAAVRFSSRDALDRMDQLSRRYGPYILVVTRPIPVLAEAAVLALGMTDLTWRAFLPPLALSNLAVAAVYSGVGHLAPPALALTAALAIPLLLTLLARCIRPTPCRD